MKKATRIMKTFPPPAFRRLKPLKPRARQAGFTLVEIMIVVLILGMLLNIAAPAFIYARDNGQQKACLANLRNITMAKEQYAIQNNVAGTVTPTWSNLSPYVKSNTQPTCPTTNQVLNLNAVNSKPTCPYGGPAGLPHVSP